MGRPARPFALQKLPLPWCPRALFRFPAIIGEHLPSPVLSCCLPDQFLVAENLLSPVYFQNLLKIIGERTLRTFEQLSHVSTEATQACSDAS